MKLLFIYIIALLGFSTSYRKDYETDQHYEDSEFLSSDRGFGRRRLKDTKCVKWGNTFDVSLSSKNLIRKCKLPDGRPICCSAIPNGYNNNISSHVGDVFHKNVGNNYHPSKSNSNSNELNNAVSSSRSVCSISKEYFSSNQELRDLAFAEKISQINSDHTSKERLDALMNYVLSPETIKNSTIWLERVRVHMQANEEKYIVNNMLSSDVEDNDKEKYKNIHHDDLEFLSRFEVTRHCVHTATGVEETQRWLEFIEPLTITARHPFAFGRCRPAQPYYQALQSSSTGGTSLVNARTDRSNVDYVLLQAGRNLHRQNYHSNSNKRILYKDDKKRGATGSYSKQPPKHYLLDSGTSTFDSSLFWFTCAYSQQQVGFDQVYAWEMTLLEPNDYWRRVPALWKPYWHFHNVPINDALDHADSPLRYIESLATPGDFVAFKLDIDHPDMEMPIALKLLHDDRIAQLVDEFFFELHFRCEVMTSCGWGKRVPESAHGLKLDRPDILKFFISLRKKGIRAHIWP